jgi:hypothetical protein
MCWFVRQYLGTSLLHQTIENQDFAAAFIRAEGKELQKMQHQLDGCGQLQCYRLQAVVSHISRFKVCNKIYMFTTIEQIGGGEGLNSRCGPSSNNCLPFFRSTYA